MPENQRFQHHPESPHLQAEDGGGHGSQENAALGRLLRRQSSDK